MLFRSEEKITLVENSKQLNELAKIYSEESEKTPREVLNDKYSLLNDEGLAVIDKLMIYLWKRGYPLTFEDKEYSEQRVSIGQVYSSATAYNLHDNPIQSVLKEKDYFDKSWEPLTYDIDKMSTVLKKYGVNTDMYEKAYQRFKHEPKGIEREDESIDDDIPHEQGPWENKFDNSRRNNPPSIS